MERFDLVVIGSGPGGQRAAIQAAKLKKRVLVVERTAIGGACVHTGTIPSKTLKEAALSNALCGSEGILPYVMTRKSKVIADECRVLENQLSRNHVVYAHGEASFVSPHELRIRADEKDEVVHAEKIVIATGSSPRRPKEIPFCNDLFFDSDSILGLVKLPEEMAVIGSGVIGCEYASIFAKLGVRVTLIDKRKELMRTMDHEIVEQLKLQFQQSNVKLEMGATLGAMRAQGDKAQVQIDGQWRSFDVALVCLGRTGNTSELSLDKAGLKVDDGGLFKVNEHYQTSQPHIYAVGDVIGLPALAASSAEQGRLASCHAFGIDGGKFPEMFPYGVYTIPEISCVGPQESELKEKGIPYVVGRARYKELARGQILGDDYGLLKIFFHAETRLILGVHIIGTSATELVHIGQVAMALGGGVEFLRSNVFNYPTLAESYKVAAYDAMNQLMGLKGVSK